MSYTDSHAHLDDPRFDSDRAEALERARAADVGCILTIAEATQPVAVEKTMLLMVEHNFLWMALGVHPHEARHATGALLDEVENLMKQPRILAWGEIGLDYHYEFSPRDAQQSVFRDQLQRARAIGLPVIIHCREAWDDCLRLLEEEWASSGLAGILHCFSGTAEHARRALDWGFMISFAGNLTFPRAEVLRAVAAAIPVEQLLTETDCPYLAPQAFRGQRNEPAFVVETAAELGRLHNLSREEMGARTTENFLRLFPRAKA
ncbi:MAG TPA: TatD family hydrolase [Candidatus Xenobia bacterium]|nr:TatD family hydrolase [Candidatus Xenobia bacterium]